MVADPTEPGRGSCLRAVLATDPTAIAELVDEPEQIGIVDLADRGLVALRHAGDLHMPDIADIAANLRRHVALDDLAVVQVHLHLEVRLPDLLADGMSFVLTVQEVARPVPGIDRLDEQGYAPLGGLRPPHPTIAPHSLPPPPPAPPPPPPPPPPL